MGKDLTNSRFYYDYLCSKTNIYEEMILYLLIAKEEYNPGFISKLHAVKYLKSKCDIGLLETKTFLELLKKLNFVDSNLNATQYLYYIDSVKDIINIIKNNIDVSLYLRIKKVKKLNNRLT